MTARPFDPRKGALWTHAEMLAARCELAALRGAMRKVEGAAMDPRTPADRSRDYFAARDEIGQSIDDLQDEIGRAVEAWH